MEQPIRVLQVLGRLDRGGAETMIMNLYRHIDREQIQFDFVIHTTECCDYTEEVKRLGGRIFSMKPFRASTAIYYRKQWKEFFAEHPEYHIIHGHMRSTASIFLDEAKKAGRVTIAHSHNTSSGKGLSAIVKNVLQYSIRYKADYLFACSKWAGEWLYGKKACESDKFHLLLNGIEPEKFQYSEDVRNAVRNRFFAMEFSKDDLVQDDSLLFLHIGRLETQKNHVFLLQVMKEIVRKRPNSQLLLCGVGPLEQKLKEQATILGIEAQVHFLGIRDDIPDLMKAADGIIFPSLFEGLPVTLVEAQAAGLPVLMSNTITNEVILTELVKTMTLEESFEAWANTMLEIVEEMKNVNRTKYAEKIAGQGYDVKENAVWLALFYKGVASVE